MKILSVIMLMLLALPFSVSGQTASDNFIVKGYVVDSITKEGEPYATIGIARKDMPQKAVKRAVTNVKGEFKENVKGKGDFIITISSVGRESITRSFTVAAGQKTVDLDTLYICDAKNELSGVEVVAQKPLVKADIDKIEYNIEDDPDAQSNTIIEMLRKVPLVTVDGEDNIKVNGSSSFKVYVNGRPNKMMSDNPTEVLKSMPANSIKRIEVITNPGPKYDAEGVGGILNIITVGSGMEGYTATFSGSASSRGLGGGAFATVKKGKLTVSARFNYNKNDNPRSWSGSELTTTADASASSSSNTKSEGSSKGDGNYVSGSLEASYEIDTLRLVSLSANMWGGEYNNNGTYLMRGYAPATGSELYRYTSLSRSKNSWKSIDGGIDYQRLFKVKDRMFTLSYKINTNPETTDSYTDYNDMAAAPDWEDFIKRMENQHNDGSTNSTEHTFQVDYTTPIGEIHTVESGVKYIIRDNKSENDRYIRPANGNSDYTFDEEQSSHYKHGNDILAAYLGYGIKVKKFSGRLGLRYEHTEQDVKYLLGRGEDFKKDLNDIVPSAKIGYKLSDMSNISIGYNMRIYRPNIWYLNPYLDDSSPSDISRGNPDLDSEKSHSFNLSFSNFTNKLNINLSLRYQFTNNSIESISYLINDTQIEGLQNPTGKDVLYNTYANIGKVRSASLSGYINWNATPNTRIYSNLYGSWSYMANGADMKNKGWSLFAYGGAQQSLPKDWRISFNVFGQTPWITLQGRGNSYFQYSLTVNKSFLKKRLTLSAYATNFFKKYTTNESKQESIGFNKTGWFKYNNQRFGISISYRIGELTAGVKKAERSIENDDVKGGKEKN